MSSPFSLSSSSASRLAGVHPDLARVVRLALELSPVDFAVVEGVRTVQRQRELYDAGASQTMKSRHLTGHAVDLAAWLGGLVRWDWPLYRDIAGAMKEAGRRLGVAIEWGGDWDKFKDGPHFQLSRDTHPGE